MTTQTETATELFELHPHLHAPKTSLELPHLIPSPSPIEPPARPSTLRTVVTILTPSFVAFMSSFTNGIINIGLPTIAPSISLSRSLYLWPSSVYGLTSGAGLLIFGSIADIIGPRSVELAGITLLGTFTLCCGFAQTGTQLVVFRALQGVALSMHLPASVSIIASAVPAGRARNLGFACLNFGQLLGFAVGLVVSGVMVERLGWRSGFYLTGGCGLGAAVVAIWTLPKLESRHEDGFLALCKRVGREIDWVGAVLSSGGLAMLAYVLAIISADLTSIRAPLTASLLATSLVLLLAFPFWMHHRSLAGKPALVPNKLWKSLPFTSTCVMVALSYGSMNSIELFSSLYFQEIQHTTPLTTSLYLLPNLTAGVLINILVGTFVHRVSARWLVSISALLCALSPLLMALMPPHWSYWKLALWAQIFGPFSADVLFTVGLIIVSEAFPQDMQALAGAVFNTVAQFGMSLGMGSCQVVALGVQGGGGQGGVAFEGSEEGDLLRGYRASFWLMCGYMVLCGGLAIWGLRKAGRIGVKRE